MSRKLTPIEYFILKIEDQQTSSQANKKLVMVRFSPEMRERIDRAAKRLGISRSAFINSSTAEKLERMET